MTLAERYAALLPPEVQEQVTLHAAGKWKELELQAYWFAGDFGREFRTTTGDHLRIVQFGVWNHEAGPDFSDAAVSINGGEARLGAIEFDQDARDWERHGHAQNPAYEGVVVHVFTKASGPEFFTRTVQHRNVPQVLLDTAMLRHDPPNPLPEAKLGRCAGPLAALPEERVRAILTGAADYRLKRKSAMLARLSEAHGADEALYQALATALGYKSNKLPFLLVAQRLPVKQLARAKEEIEALVFGVSGFLPDRDLTDFDSPTRAYLRGLWERWWRRRGEFSRLVLAAGLWRMSGQRPVNHPQRRLAALAQIVRAWSKIQRLRQRGEIEPWRELFEGFHDPYWDHHYTLTSKPSAKPMALIGESRLAEILVNVLLPLAALEGDRHAELYKKLRAPLSNRRVEVAAVRLFGGSATGRELIKSAAMQQGLLQVYEDFCMQDASDCAQCRFPRQLGQW